MSEKVDDGGMAFPMAESKSYDAQGGMTLRQWYAGKIIAGFCAAPDIDVTWLGDRGAAFSFTLADAMIAHEKKERQ